MQCKKCGNFLNEGVTVCPNCGAVVEQNQGFNSHLNDNINQMPNLMAGMANTSALGGEPQANTQNQNVNNTPFTNNGPDLMAGMSNASNMTQGVQPQMDTANQNINNTSFTNNGPDLMTGMSNASNMTQGVQSQMDTANQNVSTQNVGYENNQPTPSLTGQASSNTFSPNQPNYTNDKKTINPKLIIIAGVIAVIVIAVACFFILNNSGKVTNMAGINVWLPNGYTESSKIGYDAIYVSKENDIVIGTTKQSSYGATLDEYMEAIDSQGVSSFECEQGTKKTINGREWARYDCETSSQSSIMFMTIKDDELYGVEVSSQKDKASKSKSIANKIEPKLEIVE